MKRRIFLCLMAVLFLVGQMPATAQNVESRADPKTSEVFVAKDDQTDNYHATTDVEEPVMVYHVIEILGNGNPVTKSGSQVDLAQVRQRVLRGIQAQEEEIELTEYKISVDDFVVMMQDLNDSEPSLFYLDRGFSYSKWSDNTVAYCYPRYTMQGDVLQEAIDFYESEIDRILEESGALMVEDDLIQALLLNDYIASHYQYDLSYSIYNAYDMLKYGKAVCQGYTLLYDALLTECGIENGYARSTAMNHIWNLVKIGEHYYHVDVTWADPTSDQYSLVSHNYFMLSDAYITTNGPGNRHYGWVSSDGIVCDSDIYDENVFTNARSPFVLCGDEIYYIDFVSGYLCMYKNPFAEGEAVLAIEDIWFTKDHNGYYYPGTYSGLASVKDKLYYNTSSGVYCYDPVQKASKNLITLDKTGTNDDIIGLCYVGNNTICYAIAPDVKSNITSILSYTIPDVPIYAAEDVNCDGKIDMEDVYALLYHLSGISENPSYHVDVDNDGVVNVEDLNLLLIVMTEDV